MYFLIMITWSYLKTSNVRKAVEHFPTHTRSKWHPQPVTFQRHWVLFAKALKCQNGKKITTQKTYFSVLHLYVFAEQWRWAERRGYMRNESVCVMALTVVRKTNGHACLKPLCFKSCTGSRWKTTITHSAKQVADSFNVENPFPLWSANE